MKLTDLLDQIQERAKTAGDHVAKLCTKEDRWKMSVPAQDTDSDILLTQITDRDVPQLAKALQAVMELHEPRVHDEDPTSPFCNICGSVIGQSCESLQAITDAMNEADDA